MLAHFNRRRSLTLVGALALVVATASPGAAAPGDPDPTFDGDGRVTTDFASGTDAADAVAIQGDGKIVAAGRADVSGDPRFALARYHANGTLDTTFSGDGRVTTDFGGFDQARGVAIQGDGKIVAAGFAVLSGTFDFRYNTDGSLDPTFDGDGKVTTDFVGGNDTADAVVIQGDGKIVAAGSAAVSGGPSDFALARYNTDGSLDPTFDGDGRVTTQLNTGDQARSVVIQRDGKIVAAGLACGFCFPAAADFGIARYNADGSLDTTFSGDGKVTTDFGFADDQAFATALQSDGKIVAAGVADGTFALARYKICRVISRRTSIPCR